jgi:transcriptional regulator with XRE-family HTH domain
MRSEGARMMTTTSHSDEERRALLASFLAEHRRRIAPHVAVLGEHTRHRCAIGKLVTRHEIADASGVSRRWYQLAEQGIPTRASAPTLLRVAEVLNLDAEQCETLFRLAIPSIGLEGPCRDSIEIVEAFSSIRWYLRKLQSCSTIDELLTLIEDTAAAHFPEVSYLTTVLRRPSGGWSFHSEGIGTRPCMRVFARVQELLRPVFEADQVADETVRFPIASMPGDLLTYRNLDAAVLAPILNLSPAEFERFFEPVLIAVVRSRMGYVAHLMLSDFRNVYVGETERALAATIAEFASLALSS